MDGESPRRKKEGRNKVSVNAHHRFITRRLYGNACLANKSMEREFVL